MSCGAEKMDQYCYVSPTPQVVLQLKVMGIEDPSTFDYVTAPSRAALLKALSTLAMLGALDKFGRVTADGKRMAALPLAPAFAHLLIRYGGMICV